MCRWMAWSGQPMLMEELLFKTQHGLVDQSLHSRLGVETTNGDGFGLGWYGAGEGPGMYHSVAPAWSNANLRELAAHIEAPMFLAHVRATTGTPVQETNCHQGLEGAMDLGPPRRTEWESRPGQLGHTKKRAQSVRVRQRAFLKRARGRDGGWKCGMQSHPGGMSNLGRRSAPRG